MLLYSMCDFLQLWEAIITKRNAGLWFITENDSGACPYQCFVHLRPYFLYRSQCIPRVTLLVCHLYSSCASWVQLLTLWCPLSLAFWHKNMIIISYEWIMMLLLIRYLEYPGRYYLSCYNEECRQRVLLEICLPYPIRQIFVVFAKCIWHQVGWHII